MDEANYPLGYSDNEASRLAHQAALYEDLTADVLRRAGLAAGMQVLDLGCGVGDVALLAARMVGDDGSVLGIDRSAASIETARRRAAALGIHNARFEAAELDAFRTTQSFDALIGRFVLLYMPDAAATLRRFCPMVRAGGIVAFQEMDMGQAAAVPTAECFDRAISWLLRAFDLAGVELNMGSKLLSVFLRAGLPRPTMVALSRVESGPDTLAYALLAETLQSLLPVLERAGVVTAADAALDTLVERLRDETVANQSAVFLPRLVGAWCRLPSKTNVE